MRGVAAMEATLKKWGNSLACRIPSSLAKECGFSDLSKVEITSQNGSIIISGTSRLPVYSLEELVSQITPENKPYFSDTDFGVPVGKEIL